MIDLLNLPGVTPVDIRTEGGYIVIVADVQESQTGLCPDCSKPLYKHGKRRITFADTPIQMQPVKLEIDRPRLRCDSCGKTITFDLPFLDENRRCTRRLIDAIRKRCLSVTFHALAKETGLAVNTVKNIASDLIAELEATVKYETPTILGIDEVHLAGEYRCVLTNLSTNSVFQILEYRTQPVLKDFFKSMPDKESVEWVCTDMWRPFKASFGQYLPNARLVIDKFHVVKMASEALETMRKQYQVELTKRERLFIKKSIRWITLKRPSSLNKDEIEDLAVIRQQIPHLAQAYDFKEAFYRIYDVPTKELAMGFFEAWDNSLPPKGMEPFEALAKTVRRHYEDIFSYWDAPHRITNAYTEALNGLMKISNRLGRGYSYEMIRAKTLYAAEARKVGMGVKIGGNNQIPTNHVPNSVEYGPHIPTLNTLSEDENSSM